MFDVSQTAQSYADFKDLRTVVLDALSVLSPHERAPRHKPLISSALSAKGCKSFFIRQNFADFNDLRTVVLDALSVLSPYERAPRRKPLISSAIFTKGSKSFFIMEQSS